MPPQLQLALYGVLLGSFFLGALWRPPIALAAVLCIYGLKQWGQTSSAWLTAHNLFTNIAIGCVVLSALASRKLRGKCVLCGIQRGTWAVLALYLYALLSLFWTPRPDLAAPMWSLAYPYVTTAVFLAPLVIEDIDDLYRSYVALLIGGGTLVLALLLFAKWGDRGVLITGTAAELETNPLSIANLGGAVASAALFLRTRWLPALSWILRLLLTCVALALIVKSGSRGQLLATLLTIMLMLPVAFRINQARGLIPMLIAAVAVIGAAQYAAETLIHRDDARWSTTEAGSAANGRLQMSLQLLSHWQESGGTIIFGLGNSAAFDPEVVGSYPHNVPMEVLGEEGLVGLALYFYINWLALRGLLTGIRLTRDDPGSRKVIAVAGASYLFTLITTFKEGNMAGSAEFFMAAVILSRLPVLLARVSPHSSPSPAEPVPTAPIRFANILR
jgi:hypothetical protein